MPSTQMNDSTNQSAPRNRVLNKLSQQPQEYVLQGQAAILKKQILALEKENFTLKQANKEKILKSINENEELKKQIRLLKYENKIKSNQNKMPKKPKTEGLDSKYILDKIYNVGLLPFEYERLKIVNGYFYEEFLNILDDEELLENIVKKYSEIRKRKEKVPFYKYFMLFSCKKEIFDKYFWEMISDPKFFKVLIYCDLNWITSFFENDAFMKDFINFLENNLLDNMSVFFFKRVAIERPYLLNILLPKERFNRFLKHPYSKYLLDALSNDFLKGYVSHKNINMIDNDNLKRVFGNDFFDVAY